LIFVEEDSILVSYVRAGILRLDLSRNDAAFRATAQTQSPSCLYLLRGILEKLKTRQDKSRVSTTIAAPLAD
jgi:hypothetical protein